MPHPLENIMHVKIQVRPLNAPMPGTGHVNRETPISVMQITIDKLQDEIRDVRNIFDMELQRRHQAAVVARQEEERAEAAALQAQGYDVTGMVDQ